MKGMSDGNKFLIDFSSGRDKKIFEYSSKYEDGLIRSYRNQYDEDILNNFTEFGDFLVACRNNFGKQPAMKEVIKKAKGKKRSALELSFSLKQLDDLKNVFELSELNVKDYFEYAKAIIAKGGTGKSYLASTVNNFYVSKNDVCILGGIFDKEDVIAFNSNPNKNFDTYKKALEAQNKAKYLISELKIKENFSDYLLGDFKNLPKGKIGFNFNS